MIFVRSTTDVMTKINVNVMTPSLERTLNISFGEINPNTKKIIRVVNATVAGCAISKIIAVNIKIINRMIIICVAILQKPPPKKFDLFIYVEGKKTYYCKDYYLCYHKIK